jgi:hypothetical protein
MDYDQTWRAYDTDAGIWITMNGPSSIPDATAASGGAGTKGKLTVDSDKGLAVSNGILSLAINTSGGLEFNSSSKALELFLNGSTLSVSGSGLSVAGLPSTFTINGSSVSANVTATNLNTLTAGSGSNADSLHTHSGIGGGASGVISADYNVDESIAVGDAVYFTATGDRIGKCDAGDDTKMEVIGIAKTAQSSVGDPATIVSLGPVAVSSLTAGATYYVANGGGITATLPAAGKMIYIVGYAKSTSSLFVRPKYIGKRAA